MRQVEPQVILTSARASFNITYSDVTPPTHARTHDMHMRVHTHMHTSSYVNETFSLDHTDIKNSSLVARPLFSFPSLSVHTARTKCSLTAGLHPQNYSIVTLHKLKFRS